MCWCDPQKRTPICDTCPPEKKVEWPQYQNKPIPKPPLGIMPEKFWLERRIGDLQDAIDRYQETGKDCTKFVEERNRHLDRWEKLSIGRSKTLEEKYLGKDSPDDPVYPCGNGE